MAQRSYPKVHKPHFCLAIDFLLWSILALFGVDSIGGRKLAGSFGFCDAHIASAVRLRASIWRAVYNVLNDFKHSPSGQQGTCASSC